jgi:hypothetical protein
MSTDAWSTWTPGLPRNPPLITVAMVWGLAPSDFLAALEAVGVVPA